jgi:hypothetical protein
MRRNRERRGAFLMCYQKAVIRGLAVRCTDRYNATSDVGQEGNIDFLKGFLFKMAAKILDKLWQL